MKSHRKVVESPLRQLVRDLLREDGMETAPPVEGGDSLDSQVDRYLSDYETSSKTAKKEGFDFRMTIRRLLEAGDDAGAGPDVTDTSEPDGGGDDKAEASPEPQKMTSDDIDMDEFANNVARLIQNYDNLLEVRNTLIRRSINFISKSYDQDTVDTLTRLLRDEHGLVDGESKQDVEDEMFKAPPADRAGPGGAGA